MNGDEIIKVPWNSKAWEKAILQRDLGRFGSDGDWVLFTPRRLLVDSEAAKDDRVQRELRARNATQSDEDAATIRIANGLGLTLFTVPDDQLVEAIRAIRAIVPGSASLEHVWLPGPNLIHGDDLPVPTGDPGDIPGPDAGVGKGWTIYVLDTGIADGVPFAVDSRPIDAEVPDEDADTLRDHAAGHGTHVAGVIARGAAGARIVPRRLLTTPVGLATELDAAKAIIDAGNEGADIINCSFGGPTLFDAPPLATERALAQLPAATVVVAAVGNAGTERPNWPAASKGVIAVGSVVFEKEGGWLRADFSNHGWWVDCCAPGVTIPSTFVSTAGILTDVPAFEGFATWTGTSFSCPQVAAAIAAYATRHGVDPSRAAYELVHNPARPRIGQIGTLMDPGNLP